MITAKLYNYLTKVETDKAFGEHNKVIHDCPATGFRWKFSKVDRVGLCRYQAILVPVESAEALITYGPMAALGMIRSSRLNIFRAEKIEHLLDILVEMRRLN